MVPLRRNQHGRYYLGDREVLAYPVGPAIDTKLVFEGKGCQPIDLIQLNECLSRLASNWNRRDDGFGGGYDLKKADCYSFIFRGKEVIPEIIVKDGTVPRKITEHLLLQFFKSIPASRKNKKVLEDIFGISA